MGNDKFGREIISCLENVDMTYEFISVDKTHPTGEVSASVLIKKGNHYIVFRRK